MSNKPLSWIASLAATGRNSMAVIETVQNHNLCWANMPRWMLASVCAARAKAPWDGSNASAPTEVWERIPWENLHRWFGKLLPKNFQQSDHELQKSLFKCSPKKKGTLHDHTAKPIKPIKSSMSYLRHTDSTWLHPIQGLHHERPRPRSRTRAVEANSDLAVCDHGKVCFFIGGGRSSK